MKPGRGEAAVSIPEDLKGVIQNLKEIANNHSDDEIYAILQLCSMDPNEAAQNLLVQGSFHKVKSKRDKRKENINNKLAGDSQRRPGMQLQAKGTGPMNLSPRYNRHAAATSKIFGSRRNIAAGQSPVKFVFRNSLDSLEKTKEATLPASSVVLVTNGSNDDGEDAGVKFGSSISLGSGLSECEQTFTQSSTKLDIGVSVDSCKTHTISFGTINPSMSEVRKSCNLTSTACSSRASFPSTDCVPVSCGPLVDASKSEAGVQFTPGEPSLEFLSETSENATSSLDVKSSPHVQMILDKSQDFSLQVPQPFDPTFCYAQFYRPPFDNDGRVSPCNFASVAPSYNGNSVLLPQSLHIVPEPRSSTMMPTSGPCQLVTQPAGLAQNSATAQQHAPIFRPPGMHASRFPPNYIPYGPYGPPFYVQPPGLHQYLSNGAFAQQSQAVSVYPLPPTAAPAVVKNAVPQFRSGAAPGSVVQFGLPGGLGLHGSSAANYNHCCMAMGADLEAEDLSASQLKESNIYLGGKQVDVCFKFKL